MAIKYFRPIPELSYEQRKRFWSRVDKRGPDECWPWKAHLQPDGYGNIWLVNKSFLAHRIAYSLWHDEDPGELLVCHDCPGGPNRACCNPTHLYKGTYSDNNSDTTKHGRRNDATGDRHWTKKHPELIRYGEQTSHPKLTLKQVAEIRTLYATGNYRQKDLAAMFGVSRTGIEHVVFGDRWRD